MPVKLVVIAGPNRGAAYFLEEGETTFGRATDAGIMLASTQVSKKHFSLLNNHGKVELKDLGSANGTFLNGVLVKKKLAKNHDRISAGPFVLEILVPELPAKVGATPISSSPTPEMVIEEGQFKMEEEQPKSIVGKMWKKFDDTFLPVMYDFYEKLDYPTLIALMFTVYVVLSLGFAVYPVLQRSREEVMREAEHQSIYISEQVAYLNRQNILEGKEGSLITDFAERESHVKEVVIANMEGRILAPGNRLNEAYNNPIFLKYRSSVDQKQRAGQDWNKPRIFRDIDADEIYAFTPVPILSKTKGINIPGAIATVIYSTASLALDPGTVSSVYLEALFWSAIVGVVFLYLLYRVTHKPLEKLSEDMDKVLKGDAESVEKKYKNDIVDSLIDNVNAALGRIPKTDGSKKEQAEQGDTEAVIVNNLMRSVEYLAMNAKHPMMMVDPEGKISQVSNSFEELTGIRGAHGETLEAVSRDESFPALIREMMGKGGDAGAEGVHEDYEFNAGTHKIHGYALSGIPGKIESYLFLFEKLGD
jgi:hypothetical protein